MVGTSGNVDSWRGTLKILAGTCSESRGGSMAEHGEGSKGRWERLGPQGETFHGPSSRKGIVTQL